MKTMADRFIVRAGFGIKHCKWPANTRHSGTRPSSTAPTAPAASNTFEALARTMSSSHLRLPTYFISHGGGLWQWMKDELNGAYDKLEAALKAMPGRIGMTPKAVLVISGHWEEREITIMSSPRPPMIYDYSGFPEHTYRIRYAAPGSPRTADRVQRLVEDAGFATRLDPVRGFDHGTFAPLAVIYPNADVPVLKLSMRKGYDPMDHIAIGRARHAVCRGTGGPLMKPLPTAELLPGRTGAMDAAGESMYCTAQTSSDFKRKLVHQPMKCNP